MYELIYKRDDFYFKYILKNCFIKYKMVDIFYRNLIELDLNMKILD